MRQFTRGKNDPELNVLRQREDFKALMRELESTRQTPGTTPTSQ
jgi:hypothetical protein